MRWVLHLHLRCEHCTQPSRLMMRIKWAWPRDQCDVDVQSSIGKIDAPYQLAKIYIYIYMNKLICIYIYLWDIYTITQMGQVYAAYVSQWCRCWLNEIIIFISVSLSCGQMKFSTNINKLQKIVKHNNARITTLKYAA